MMQFNIARTPASTFVPVTVTLTVDGPADLILLTNLFGGVPAEAATPAVNDLANALRATCDESGIAKSMRKTVTGFNWGRKLREALAEG